MKYLSKKIIFMLILASHAHQAQAAQTALVSPVTQAAELAAQTLQSAKYYWNYLKKSMRAGTAKAITVAQKHPKIVLALTAVSVLFLAKSHLKNISHRLKYRLEHLLAPLQAAAIQLLTIVHRLQTINISMFLKLLTSFVQFLFCGNGV